MLIGQQVGKGAAGLIIVRDPEEAALDLPRTYGVDDIPSVSYTHLRAHETVLDLVCRLLLEKKKKDIIYKICRCIKHI